MLGEIIGDMVVSKDEFNPIKSKEFNIFDKNMRMTDDSYLTIAVAKTLLKHYPIKYDEQSLKAIQEDLGKEFIDAWLNHRGVGFGGRCLEPAFDGGRGGSVLAPAPGAREELAIDSFLGANSTSSPN